MESGTRGSITRSEYANGIGRRFLQLYAKWKEDGVPFDALDYSIETPVGYGRMAEGKAWAVYGSNEQGFDPSDVRKKRRRVEESTEAAEPCVVCL